MLATQRNNSHCQLVQYYGSVGKPYPRDGEPTLFGLWCSTRPAPSFHTHEPDSGLCTVFTSLANTPGRSRFPVWRASLICGPYHLWASHPAANLTCFFVFLLYVFCGAAFAGLRYQAGLAGLCDRRAICLGPELAVYARAGA